MHVVAQSVGAVLIATWAHDYAPKVRGLTLASPAFKVKLYVPFARAGLGLMHKLRGLFFVNSYVKAKFLTHDPERIASYESDPLISRPIAVNILLGLYEAADRVVADANAITLPVQLLISGADWVVHHKPQHEFFERLGSAVKTKTELPGFFHDTLGEKDRAPAVAQIREFILQRFDAPAVPVDRREAHLSGDTADESRALAEPLSPLSPRGAYWAITRASLRWAALSERHQAGPRHRLRLGQHARLRVPQPARRARGPGPEHRQHLPQLHRLARHPPAQDPCRGAAAHRDGAAGRNAPRGARDGHRRRPWPLRARRGACQPGEGQRRSCCATTATSTCATAAR
jgi:hypothetical protein